MTEKQKNLRELFLEVDEICKKHNLRYVMAGGTLLGVVRHEGFIPWDDDVDIYMPRDDWYKLVELAKTELPPDRAVECVEVDREFTNTFPRYGSTDSCAIHRHQIIGKDKAGEIIDVLTLDPIPPDDREYEKYRTHMMIYSDLVNISAVFGSRYEVPVGMYLKYLLSYIFLGRDRTLGKLEKIMFSYEEDQCPRYAMRWGGCPFLFSKEMMFPVKYMEFEGTQVMVPQHVSDYLIWHYGDEWSYIPPHGERESHDTVSVEGMTYEEFRKEYMPRLKPGKLRFDAVMRKLYYLAGAKRSHRVKHKRQRLMAQNIEMDLKARLSALGKSLEQMEKERDFAGLNDLYEEYFRVQLSADFIGREDFVNIYSFYHPMLIGIDDNAFYGAMLTLFYTERVAKAYRMLKVKESLSSLTTEMKKLMEDILLFRKAVDHYEFNRKEETKEIVDGLMEKYPDHPSFMKLKIRLVMEKAREKKSSREAEGFVKECLALFPEDGYFLKYKAEILWMQGKCRDALVLFATAREQTNNGITHLEIDKFLKEYKTPAVKTCKELLESGHKKEADELMELWARLLPEDEEIRDQHYMTRVETARTQDELEEVLQGITNKAALTRAFERLGYDSGLARLRTELLDMKEPDEMELLAQKIRNEYIIIEKNQCAEAYKLLGDVRMKQGYTGKAFESYRQAAACTGHSYVKKELYRIVFQDLSKGSRRAAAYAKNVNAMDFMDHWLGKYGELEDLRQLVQRLE